MPRGYEDDYGRERVPARRENRDRDRDRVERPERDRHTATRVVDDRLETRDTRVIDEPMDIRSARMDPRLDPRANAAARLEPRTERLVDPRREPEVMYRDVRTGQVYQEPPSRTVFPREDRMDYDDYPPQQRSRIIDTTPTREDDVAGSRFNSYFVPADGIEREVIQHEICKYLGQDATCRPYQHDDGRQGYLVRAYRPFTSEMIRSLKEDSARWAREQRTRQRSGRSGGSYAEMQDRIESTRFRGAGDTMDIDDDLGPPSRNRGDVDSRPGAGGRHATIPTTAAFEPSPGYPQYLVSNQPGSYNPASEPRYAGNPGGSTPPNMGRSGQSGYNQAGYPARTVTGQPPLPPTTYRDPRTGQLVTTYAAPASGPDYPAEQPRSRHR